MKSARKRAADGLQAGDSFTASRTFTEKDVMDFARISRDFNPVHFDHRFAEAKDFPAPICHGLLTASIITEVGGQIGWLASSMNFRFKRPVYVGDTITCTFVITTVDQNGRAEASAVVKQKDKTVIEAEISGIVPQAAERRILNRLLLEGDPTTL